MTYEREAVCNLPFWLWICSQPLMSAKRNLKTLLYCICWNYLKSVNITYSIARSEVSLFLASLTRRLEMKSFAVSVISSNSGSSKSYSARETLLYHSGASKFQLFINWVFVFVSHQVIVSCGRISWLYYIGLIEYNLEISYVRAWRSQI